MKKNKQNWWKNDTFVLCYLTALKDKEGKVFKDEQGRTKYLTSFPPIEVKIIPNPDSDGDMFEYLLCLKPGSTILPGLGYQDKIKEDE